MCVSGARVCVCVCVCTMYIPLAYCNELLWVVVLHFSVFSFTMAALDQLLHLEADLQT
jgi:hypothetical protein